MLYVLIGEYFVLLHLAISGKSLAIHGELALSLLHWLIRLLLEGILSLQAAKK